MNLPRHGERSEAIRLTPIAPADSCWAKKLITACIVVWRKIDRFSPRAMIMEFGATLPNPQ
jgi:hypothetical protein